MTEQWRDVPGWEGFYAVSDEGRVKSLARSVPGRPGVLINKRERFMTLHPAKSGHRLVHFSRNNIKVEKKVHRLVLEAFVGPCPDGMEGCHHDGHPANNNLSNLRWDTRSSNTFDKVRHGVHPMARKTHCDAGHPFTPANTYTPPGRPMRCCRACRLEAKRRYNNRKKAAA